LLEAVENGRNVTLISPRRYGKTGLIHHLFHSLQGDYATVYLDIYATKNLLEFTKLFVSSIIGAVDTPLEKTLSSVSRFFKSCRPTITPQENGLPKFSVDLVSQEVEATLRDAFAYLKNHKRRLVIAIDEFQQILEYPETGTEALLRSVIQEIPWVRFIFAGSRHHLMGEMFLSAKHPFYQSTDIMSLRVIPKDNYADFAERHFRDSGQSFGRAVFDALYERFDGVTWYVQSVLNRIWLADGGLLDVGQVAEVVDELVEDRALLFHDLLDVQGAASQTLLSAIAAEGVVREVYAGSFIHRNHLKAASTVRSALKVLVNSDLVYRGEKGYEVYDRLFGEWLKRKASYR